MRVISRKGLNRDITVGINNISVIGGGWYYTGTAEIESGETNRHIVELIKAGRLRIFGPDGIEAEIQSTDGKEYPVDDITQSITLPVGSYRYTITHNDYKIVKGEIQILADTAESINPNYEHNEKWAIRQQIVELEDKKSNINKIRSIMLPIAWSFTGIGGAGIGNSGVMEGLIQSSAVNLESYHDEYSNSSDADYVKSIAEEILALEDNISLYRTIRDYSLIGGGGSLLIGGLIFLIAPGTDSIDEELADLRRMVK